MKKSVLNIHIDSIFQEPETISIEYDGSPYFDKILEALRQNGKLLGEEEHMEYEYAVYADGRRMTHTNLSLDALGVSSDAYFEIREVINCNLFLQLATGKTKLLKSNLFLSLSRPLSKILDTLLRSGQIPAESENGQNLNYSAFVDENKSNLIRQNELPYKAGLKQGSKLVITPIITLNFQLQNSEQSYTHTFPLFEKVSDILDSLDQIHQEHHPDDRISERMIRYQNQILASQNTLNDYGISSMDTLILIPSRFTPG